MEIENWELGITNYELNKNMKKAYLYIFNIIIFVFICNITFAQTDSLELNEHEQELLTNFNNDKEGWLSDFFDGTKLIQAITIRNLNKNQNLLNRMHSFDNEISQTYFDTTFHIYLQAFMDDQSMWAKIFNQNNFESWNKQEFGSQNSYIKLELKLNRMDEDNLTLLVSNEMSNSGDPVSNQLQTMTNEENYHQSVEKQLSKLNIKNADSTAIQEIDNWQEMLGIEDVAGTLANNIKIIPDNNQCGVIGDTVKSAALDGKLHFVSPKGGGDIIFTVNKDIYNTAFTNNFKWIGGTAISGNPKKVKVSRASPSLNTLYLIDKQTNDTLSTMYVWIVWADWKSASIIESTASLIGHTLGDTIVYRQSKTDRVQFVAEIKPKAIIDGSLTNNDIPDFISDLKPLPDGTSDGINMRWDVSRQKRRFYYNSSPTNISIVKSDLNGTQSFQDEVSNITFPISYTTIGIYPSNSLVGNDDNSATDEDNNPYPYTSENIPSTNYSPLIGEIGSMDRPTSPLILPHAGNNGETVEIKIQFREFVRLQIGNSDKANYKNWYKISDFKEWQSIKSFINSNGNMIDNNSRTEFINN